jgi:hypothetical protein
MTTFHKIAILTMGLAILGVLIIVPYFVTANQSIFQPKIATSSATTSPNYMTTGTATTTLSMDAHSFGESSKIDNASLLVQFHASSSLASTLNFRFQFSDDNINWYDENEVLNSNATTTQITHGFHEYTWLQAASTTEKSTIGNGTATSSQSSRLISIPTPTRYVRTLFYVPAGSQNAAVYAEIISVKQKEE